MTKKTLTLRDIGRKGGKATKKNYGRSHFQRIGALGGKKRSQQVKAAQRKKKHASKTSSS